MAHSFETTEAGTVFVKVSPKLGAIRMFESQAESLRVIEATDTLRYLRLIVSGWWVCLVVRVVRDPDGSSAD